MNKNMLGICDNNGTQIKVGDFVRWAVHQIIIHAGFPVMSYCYSEKGKVLPSGYTRGFLSDLYDPKELLWIEKGLASPCDESIVVIDSEEVDMALVRQTELR